MTRTRNIVLAIIGVTGFLLAASALYRGIRRNPQESVMSCRECNILVIVLDPLRADALSSLGNLRPTTPALDRLASRGFLFTNAYAVAPWTLPSAMSMLTGVYPSVHHITNKEWIGTSQNQGLVPARLATAAPDIRTLATELKQHGYVTGGFAGGAALSGSFGFDQGFDAYVSDGTFEGMSVSVSHALGFMRQHSKEKMFVFVHGFDVHGQYIPTGGFDHRYIDPGYAGTLTGSAVEQKALREDGVRSASIFLSPADMSQLRAFYDEKVSRADELIGAFLENVASLPLAHNTIIVIASNHGDEFYEHGRIDHGMTLFDEVLHIPLIIAIPGATAARRVASQVRNIDIAPTILDIAGVIPSAGFADQCLGESLVPLMEGRTLKLDLYAETEYRYATFQKSLRTSDGWKLILDEETQMKKLFNVARDPEETFDLFGQGESRESGLVASLWDFVETMRSYNITQR